MKSRLFFLSLNLVFLMITSCQKDEFDMNHPNVDRFVQLLKSGEYKDKAGYELPDFSFNHLEDLMQYLKDTTCLSMFPTNPVSSMYTNPKILNECLLWTIDGIRFGVKYPSLEPCLLDTLSYTETTGFARVSGTELLELSDKYIDWYEEYKENPSEQLRSKNLLDNTPYIWN